MQDHFAQEILQGFRAKPKRLPSKFFYDDRGSQLFQQIMQLPEYYLTNCEYEIFSQQSREIIQGIAGHRRGLDVLELGAGDGSKTLQFLKEAQKATDSLSYQALDISSGALESLKKNILSEMPDLSVQLIHNTYFEGLAESQASGQSKVVFFLGSTIGNFSKQEANSFLLKLAAKLAKGDYLLLGVDLMKDPRIILSAYNDKSGTTRAFNLNLLHRINRELEANIDVDNFEHYPTYDPLTGECRSYLIPLRPAEIKLGALNETIGIGQWEAIHLETSTKYGKAELEALAPASGFEVVEHFFDCRHYYTLALWRKV